MNDSEKMKKGELDARNRAYFAALSEAYPQPKTDIHARVMAQIREERAAEKRKKLRFKRMGMAVRWGSAAACIALCVLIGVKVLPDAAKNTMLGEASMDRAPAPGNNNEIVDISEVYGIPEREDATASESYDVPNDCLTSEDEMNKADANVLYPSPEANTADGSDSTTEENPEGNSDGANKKTYMYMTQNNCTPMYGNGNPNQNNVQPGAGVKPNEPSDGKPCDNNSNIVMNFSSDSIRTLTAGLPPAKFIATSGCVHSGALGNSYHDIPHALIVKVGEEKFNKWVKAVREEDPCGVNILAFAIKFSLTREDILGTGDVWYCCDIPDIEFTEDNAEAIGEYYINGGDYAVSSARYSEYCFKTQLIADIGVLEYSDWCKSGEPLMCGSLRDMCIADFAHDFSIDEDDLVAIYNDVVTGLREKDPGCAVYEYDFDKMYAEIENINSAADGYVPGVDVQYGADIDAMFHK